MTNSEIFKVLKGTHFRRKQKEKLLQQAALAEKEEKQHEMLQGKIWKTASYCDRNRFRCFGAPMLLQNDRESFRSHSVMSAHLQAEERRHVETPLQDSFHAHEFPLRSHSVLKTHSTKKPVRMFGLRSDKSGETQILSQSIPRPTPNGRVDVVGYGSSTQVVISEEPPEETERSLINETLMANSVRMPFLSDSKRRTRPRTSMSESGGSNENFRPW